MQSEAGAQGGAPAIMRPIRAHARAGDGLPKSSVGKPCGATTRRGAPCRIRETYPNGRCKFHGGASTGPRTDEGKARARANLALRWVSRP